MQTELISNSNKNILTNLGVELCISQSIVKKVNCGLKLNWKTILQFIFSLFYIYSNFCKLRTKIPFLNKYFIFKIKMLQKFNLEINADQLSPLEPPRMSKLLKDTIIKILILGFFNLLTFINKNEKIPYPIRPKTLCPIWYQRIFVVFDVSFIVLKKNCRIKTPIGI